MEQQEILTLLQQVAEGSVTPQQAELQLKMAPFEDLGFAKLDHHRALRQGVAEVIYGSGKTPDDFLRVPVFRFLYPAVQRLAGDSRFTDRSGKTGRLQ